MPRSSDDLLLESVKTQRARLRASFLFGWLADRRQMNDNVKRLTGSVVLAAVACVGCLGWSFVSTTLADQAAERQRQSAPAVQTSPSSAASPTDAPGTAAPGDPALSTETPAPAGTEDQ